MRPDIGTLRGAATLNDESYLDFVEGMRAFNLGRMVPRLVQAGDRIGAEMAEGSPAASPKQLFNALDSVPAAQFARRMMRSTQLMMWRGVGESYGKVADQLEEWLADAER